ncbi:cyclase family protein [Desulfolucanica intricata]|uniref:cyclase family protein n=1 Tax=Desulfolucanica intricata TaxID=1285191 RepID=UPI0008342831|nr:cyclase family protein [Desulfolucanica intricata]
MKFIDLTQYISAEMPVYPGTEPPKFSCPCTIEKNGFREDEITLYTHTGTHVDSPAHLFKGGPTLDLLPIEHFIGSATVIDCSHLTKGEKISLNYLSLFMNKLVGVDFVIFYTGWSKKWGQSVYFKDFPVPSLEVAQMLGELNLKGVGIDAISVDPVSSQQLSVHRKLLSQNIIIIENLTNLDKLINQTFIFSCFPLKIDGADGSPIRAVARLE